MNAKIITGVVIAAVAFILIGIAMAFGPTMLEGFELTRVDTTAKTEVFTNVTKAGAVPGTANTSVVTLAIAPYPANNENAVTSVSSNESSDTPVINRLVGTSANFTGMNDANPTRTLTVTYNYHTTGQYTGLSSVIGFGPTMILLGFIITVGLGGFMGITIAGLGVYQQFRE